MANLPNVNCQFGAPMGRGEAHAADAQAPIKFWLSRVYLNSGGYDSGGAYWGFGGLLYQAKADAPTAYAYGGDVVTFYLRASGRDDAKAQVCKLYPKATVYR
jgi:hypothetical protein